MLWGCAGRYDEWIDRDSDRLALLGSHRGPTEWGLITPANQDKVLWQCIQRDDAEVLRRLLTEFTVDINSLNKGGQTPLVCACLACSPACLPAHLPAHLPAPECKLYQHTVPTITLLLCAAASTSHWRSSEENQL